MGDDNIHVTWWIIDIIIGDRQNWSRRGVGGWSSNNPTISVLPQPFMQCLPKWPRNDAVVMQYSTALFADTNSNQRVIQMMNDVDRDGVNKLWCLPVLCFFVVVVAVLLRNSPRMNLRWHLLTTRAFRCYSVRLFPLLMGSNGTIGEARATHCRL